MDRNFTIAPINASDYVQIPMGKYYAHEINGRPVNDWVQTIEVKGNRFKSLTAREKKEKQFEQLEQVIRKETIDNLHREHIKPIIYPR